MIAYLNPRHVIAVIGPDDTTPLPYRVFLVADEAEMQFRADEQTARNLRDAIDEQDARRADAIDTAIDALRAIAEGLALRASPESALNIYRVALNAGMSHEDAYSCAIQGTST